MIFNSSKYNTHWHDKKLSDLGKFQRGKSKHRPRNDSKLFKDGLYPLIQTGEIKEANLYILQHKATYNEFGLSQSKLWPKNTLCITIAANIAETALLSYPMCFPDSVVGFNAYDEESSELFMHYVFTFIKKAIQNSASGSIQDNINIDYLTNLKFKIPEKKYQDKIASVLSSLDAKIELNNRINAELEAIAKTLYDYWFVQFDFPDENSKPYKSSGGEMEYNAELKREIPKGWEVISLVDIIVRSGTGLNPRDNFSLGSGENYYVTIKNIVKGKILLNDKCDKIDDNALQIIDTRSQLEKGDILFTSIEPIGDTYLLHEKPQNWNINESIFTLRPDTNKITSEYFLMLLSSEEMKSFTKNVSTGSIHKGIRHSVLKTFKLPYFDQSIINNFTKIIDPILKRIHIIDQENQQLTELRDWLLPMLMNGQIKVMDDTVTANGKHR